MDVRLLIIDPQEDFCNPDWGTLFVPGSVEDCEKTASMISRLNKRIQKIYVTFDSHRQYQIFHPMFWIKNSGDVMNPFDLITHADVMNGDIIPVDVNMLDWCKTYTKALEDGGRYPLVIWPYHCLIGTPGWNMNPLVMKAILDWEKETYKMYNPITKGSNFKTEHYSAVKAEVNVPEDPSTQLNQKGIIEPLENADIVAIAGQARSHCVANTVRDIMDSFSDPSFIKKLYILEDATSDVPTFEKLGEDFIKDFVKAGGNLTTTDKFLT